MAGHCDHQDELEIGRAGLQMLRLDCNREPVAYQLSAHSTGPAGKTTIERSKVLGELLVDEGTVGYRDAFMVRIERPTKPSTERSPLDAQFQQETAVGGPYYESPDKPTYMLALGWVDVPKTLYLPFIKLTIGASANRRSTLTFDPSVTPVGLRQTDGISDSSGRNVVVISSQSTASERIDLVVSFRYFVEIDRWELIIREKE